MHPPCILATVVAAACGFEQVAAAPAFAQDAAVAAGVDAYNHGDLNNLGTSYLFGPGGPLDKPLGTSLITRAAMRGHAGSQQLLRRAGYGAPLPAAVDTSGMMRLVPQNARAGHAQVCGELIS